MSRAQARPQGSPILGTSRIGGWMETEEGNFCAKEKIGHSVMQPENTTNETNKHQHSELERNLKLCREKASDDQEKDMWRR